MKKEEVKKQMMREIGGYIELDTYHLPMLHEGAIALNCGRNALAYVLKAKSIKRLQIPYFLCDSVNDVCQREQVSVSYYHIGMNFKPVDVYLDEGEWLYLVNYYGQLSNDDIQVYVDKYKKVIVDQAQSYFQLPIKGVDTLYTCRKWFGVADGAFLYSDAKLSEELPTDESYKRMGFLLGRYERTASEFYKDYSENNQFFVNEQIKRMSKLTNNLLHGIDYTAVEKRRNENFFFLHDKLKDINQLIIRPTSFMYPLMVEDGNRIRKAMQQQKIYIPTLWPSVFDITDKDDNAYKMAENILPLPIDQRYNIDEMDYMIKEIMKCLTL